MALTAIDEGPLLVANFAGDSVVNAPVLVSTA